MLAIVILTVAGAVALTLTYVIWRRNRSPSTTTFALLMAGASIWSLGYALELSQSRLASAILWAKVQYIGIVTIPTAWLLFAWTYSQRTSHTTRRRLLLLLLPQPITTLIMTWGYPVIRWQWATVTYAPYKTLHIADFVPGPWYTFHVAYSYTLLILGTLCLAVYLRAGSHTYRRQVWTLLAVIFAPWIGNLLYIFGLTPWSHFDMTPFGFIIAGVAAGIGLLRFQILNIVPIARDLVLETMRDGVIIINTQGMVVDYNGAARDLLELQRRSNKNREQPIEELLPGLRDVSATTRIPAEFQTECIWQNRRLVCLDDCPSPVLGDTGESTRYIGLQMMPIQGKQRTYHGYYLLISDIALQVRTRAIQQRDTENLTALVSARTSEMEATLDQLRTEVAERNRVEASLRRQNQQLSTLNAVAAVLRQELTVPQALEAALVEIMKLPRVHYAWVSLFPEEPGTQTILAPGADLIPVAKLTTLLAQDTAEVTNTHESRTVSVPIGLIPGHETCSLVLVPVAARDSVLGVVILIWNADDYSSEHDLTLIEAICHEIGLTVENARLIASSADIEVWQKLGDLRSELIANVSHEIRTPLGLIKLFATALQLDQTQSDPEGCREFLRGIEEETEHLEAIISDLLNIGQADRGHLNLDRQLLDLQQLTWRLLTSMRLEIGERHLTRRFSDHPVIVNVDRQRLSQVLRNLITNAIKYSPATSCVTVTVRSENDRAVVSIEDQGIGIPSEEQPHIFERFYRVDNEVTRRTRGTGLGLAISKTIIEAHGGSIWFSSQSGAGSTFSFSLPTASAEESVRLPTFGTPEIAGGP